MTRFQSALDPVGLRGKLLKAGAVAFSVRILAIFAGLISSIVLARVLGPSEYGIYAFAIAVLSILALPVQLGLPTLVVRETASAVAVGDWSLIRGIWSWAVRVITLTSALITGLCLVGFFVASKIEITEIRALTWGLPLIPILAFSEVRSAALRGLKHVFMAAFPDKVLRPTLLAGFVGIAATTGTVQASNAIALYSIAGIVALAVGAITLWRARPMELRQAPKSRHHGAAWRRSLLPLSMIVGFNVISQNTDLIMLGVIRSDEEVSFYRIALSISSLALFGLTATNLLIQPYLAEASAKKDHARLQKLATASCFAALSITVSVVFIIWFAGEWLIGSLYGSAYVVALLPLLILIIGQTVSAFFGSVGHVLTMSGNEGQTLRILAFSTAVNIVLNILLIPAYGTAGAAIATGTSTVLVNTLFWSAAMRTIGINSSPFGLIKLREGR